MNLSRDEGRNIALHFRVKVRLPEEAPETLQAIDALESAGMEALVKIMRDSGYTDGSITTAYFVT